MTAATEVGGGLAGCFLLTEDCKIHRINGTVTRWLGYTPDEIAGRPFHVLLGGGGQFFLQSQILPMLKLKGTLEEVYLRLKEKSGATVSILANIGYASVDGAMGIEVAFIRIIQRGKLEDELLLAKKLAEQANDAKTKFLGMMSHELRTPLQLISLNNQMLIAGEYGPLPPEHAGILRTSQDATDSVVVIIDDILSYARMQGGPVLAANENVSVAHALDRAETSIRHRVQENGLNFRRECFPADLVARADANRLQQVLINLLNNALKFTPRGGNITLTGRLEDERVVFAVEDTGCGIPAEQLERVFEPFVQLSTTIESTDKPGVGLGLAICRDLTRAMNGKLSVQSTVGRGSIFRVMLPRGRLENPGVPAR